MKYIILLEVGSYEAIGPFNSREEAVAYRNRVGNGGQVILMFAPVAA